MKNLARVYRGEAKFINGPVSPVGDLACYCLPSGKGICPLGWRVIPGTGMPPCGVARWEKRGPVPDLGGLFPRKGLASVPPVVPPMCCKGPKTGTVGDMLKRHRRLYWSPCVGNSWYVVPFVKPTAPLVGGGRRRRLLRQVELAVVLVFERVQRALPAIDVPVATLDAWLVHYCWHGRSPRVRSPSVGNCWSQQLPESVRCYHERLRRVRVAIWCRCRCRPCSQPRDSAIAFISCESLRRVYIQVQQVCTC